MAAPATENKKKILLVEDDSDLAKVLGKFLELKSYDVVHASDGAAGKQFFTAQHFDLVVSDIRMPGVSGIELLHFIKNGDKPCPVILMTGFSEILEAIDAHELGADGFLAKPFLKDVFLDLVQKIASGEKASKPAESDEQYVGIRIEEFVTGREIQFDIFVQLGGEKFVKVANGGESLDFDRVLAFKAKGVNHLFLRRQDFAQYIGFTADVAKKVAASENIDAQKKAQFLAQTSKALLSGLYCEKIDKEQFDAVSDLVINSVLAVQEHTAFFRLFLALRDHSEDLYLHGLAVALYSALIGRELGWRSPRTISLLALCGALHDIGKREIPADVLKKDRLSMSPEEIAQLDDHPKRGFQLIKSVEGIPVEVALVALQHHEDCRGQGYPQKLSKTKILPLARLIAVANAFCHYAFPAPNSPSVNPEEAFAKMKADQLLHLDEEFVDALSKLLGIPVAEKKAG